jgi:RNA polymerase sigma factor (sigma-70 family)
VDPDSIDQELLLGYYGGHQRALDALHARHADRLLGLAHACLRNHPNADYMAWDAAQEVWLRVARTRETGEDGLARWEHGKGTVGHWLNAILRNCVRNLLRGRRQHLPLPEDDGGPGATLEATDGAPGSQPENTDLWSWCLGQLSEVDQRIVEGLYLDGRSQTEIAQELHCSNAFVSQHLSAARKHLRELLARQGITEL